jgi:hypothetical protein
MDNLTQREDEVLLGDERGGAYSWTTHLRGDGGGTPADTLRLVIEVDVSASWRTWSDVARKKGWKR